MGSAQHAWDCFAEQEWEDAAAIRALMHEHLRAAAPHLRSAAALDAADRLAEAALRLDAGLAVGEGDEPQEWEQVYAQVREDTRPVRRSRAPLRLV